MYLLAVIAQTERKKDEIENLLKSGNFVYHIMEKNNEDSIVYEIYVPDTEIETFQNLVLA
jgi:hypothetical protein